MTRAGSQGAGLARRDPLAAAFEGPFGLMSRLIQDMDRIFYGMSPMAAPRSSFHAGVARGGGRR